MNKKAIILHGTFGSPQGNWFQWLGTELEKENYQVWIPQLPLAEKPNIQRYNNFLFENLPWPVDTNTCMIGHSSGAVAILGFLTDERSDAGIDTAYLISEFKDDLDWDPTRELFERPLDYKIARKKAKKFYVIHSDNDPYVPLDHAEFLAENLNGRLIIKQGQGHFNTEKSPSYTEFPFLLNLILVGH